MVPDRYMRRSKVIPPKLVLQGKVTKLKREVKYFDETFKEIRTAMLDFLNGSPKRGHQFQINVGLRSLKSHVDEVLEAMECVSLKENNARDDEEDDKADEEAEQQSEEETEEAEEVGEDEDDDKEDN